MTDELKIEVAEDEVAPVPDEAADAPEPADEGLVCEQPARMRMVARARVARVVLMMSPG